MAVFRCPLTVQILVKDRQTDKMLSVNIIDIKTGLAMQERAWYSKFY